MINSPYHEQPTADRGDRDAAVAQLERAVQVEPRNAEQWCRLGEFYQTLAADAADEESATAWGQKATAALTQAISLSPGLAEAHYALANVYSARDMCLALVEYEAAAKCDPQKFGAALSRAQKAVRDRTFRLRDLNLIRLESAREKPRAEVLGVEFYFDVRPIRSAVMYECQSEGARQQAKVWLFEAEDPQPDKDQPAAHAAVSSNGNVYLSNGCPSNYQQLKAQVTKEKASLVRSHAEPTQALAKTQAPPSITHSAPTPPATRTRRSLKWLPVALGTIALAGGAFAYRSLVAPIPTAPEKRADVSSELRKAPRIRVTTGPAPSHSDAAEAESRPNATASTPVTRQSSGPPRASSSAQSSKAARVEARPKAESAAVRSPRKGEAVATTQVPMAVGATGSAAPETRPVTRTEPSPAAPAPVQREHSAAAQPAQREQHASIASGQREIGPPVAVYREPPVPAPVYRSPPPENNWIRRMRSEADRCGAPGILQNDICRESVRWRYCHPNRWDTVRDCVVERFASTSSN